MVLELIACVMLAGSSAGMVGTLVVWMKLDARRSRRFVQAISKGSPYTLTAARVEDTVTPVVLTFESDGMVVDLLAAGHGAQPTWKLRVALPHSADLPAFELMDARWARASVEHVRRSYATVHLGLQDDPFQIYGEDVAGSQQWLADRHAWAELDRAVSECGLRQVGVRADAVELELLRTGLEAPEALGVVEAALRLTRVILGVHHTAPEGLRRPSQEGAEHAHSGVPAGVPVMRRTR